MKTHFFNHFFLASNLVSFFLLFIKISLYAQKPIDLQSGFVAYYSFDNSVRDSSGNNLHGETIHVNLDRDVSGEKKGSYRWNSKKDQIKLPIDMNVGAMLQVSLCAWVQPQKYAGQMIVISNDDRGGDRKLFTAIKDNKLVWACSNGKEGFIGNTPVENKKWVFLVATYDEKTKTAAIYVDGIKTSGSTQMDMGASYTLVGANPRGNEKFEGLIDEVRIYSRILSKSEIDSLRNLKPIVNQIETTQKSYFYFAKQDNLIVHAKPNIESKSIGTLNAVDTLRFTETVPTTGGKYAEWLKINLAGKTGYVQLSYLKHTSTEDETKTELQKTLDKYVDWSKWQFWVGMLVFLIIGYWASLK
ncbi:MAG: SH3 domain-containing protein, partial [Bacteroidales bacterium]|nr:SH3 domain-containing protein [Bacteroidales bacterium]